MIARVVASVRGAQWLAEGWRLFRASPLGWLVMVFAYLMGTMLLSLLPLAGPVLVAIAVPALSVGFMAASRAASRRQPVELSMLFAGFRERTPAQLVLGAVYAIGFFGAIVGSSAADDGALMRLLFEPVQASPGDDPLPGMLAAVVLYLPTMALLWFAPVLVAWHGFAPLKALFYSVMACWLNLGAFVVYAIALGLLLFAILGAATLVAVVGPAGASAAAERSLVFPLALVVMPTLFASYFASYRDVFAAPQEP
ncbi:MAG: BPSS1780 family membrane protein [Burkholderiales bacterium]